MAQDEKTEVNMGGAGLQLAEPSKPVNLTVWRIMLLIGTFIYGSYTILVHLCEVDGKIPFSSASMVLVQEIMKMMISIFLFIPEVKRDGFKMPTLKFALPFSIPAILYCFNNNISVQMQLHMDPATYQVLGNLKILSTAFLYRIIIKKPILPLQWVALGLLATAGISNSYGGLHAKGVVNAGTIHVTIQGILMMATYCFVSGLAGVYTEYILKSKYQTSLHLQNILLYIFGIFLNGGAWIAAEFKYQEKGSAFNLFRGYSLYTVVIIVTQACSGLIMSAIMKHSSNIARLFIISCAMLVTTALSMMIFGLKLNLFFSCSFLLVVVALVLYHKN